MKTLKQWHEELGEEFYKTEFKSEKAIFSPKFICNSGPYCGLDRGLAASWDAENPIWTIYTPPKPKVVRWLWAGHCGIRWGQALTFYTESEAKTILKNENFKLEWSRTEFED